MRRARVIESADEFAQVRELWERLFASGARAAQPRAAAPTLFQSYAWNQIAARVFAERERPYVVVAESDSGAAIIPACVRRDAVSLLGEELFDYRDVLSSGDGEALEAAWSKIAWLKKPFAVKAVRGEREWAGMRPFAGAPYLPRSVKLPRNKSLERNLRLLAEQGCRSRHQAIGSSGDMVRRMYELKGRQQSGSLFRDPLRVAAVGEMGASAPTEVFTIERDGESVAATLTFIDGDVCRFYGTYYDQRWARFSPGISLLYRVIEQAQARGMDFDFMTGEQPYKLRFASEVVPLYTGHLYHRGFAAA